MINAKDSYNTFYSLNQKSGIPLVFIHGVGLNNTIWEPQVNAFENSVLTIKSVKDKDEKEVEDNDGVLHKGIAKRMFTKSFTIAEDVEIKGAELKDGLLNVSMEKVIPEHKKARTIEIK